MENTWIYLFFSKKRNHQTLPYKKGHIFHGHTLEKVSTIFVVMKIFVKFFQIFYAKNKSKFNKYFHYLQKFVYKFLRKPFFFSKLEEF